MKKKMSVIGGIAIVAFAVTLSQCSKKNSYSAPAPPAAKVVGLRTDVALGNYLVDTNGHALYFFANDADGRNNCSGPCALSWTAYGGGGLSGGQLDAGLDLSDFGSTASAAGGTQLTYRGWPLYTYNPSGTPEAAGRISGDGVGGIWFVAKPDYSIMLANFQLVGKDGNNYKSDYTEGTGRTIYFTDDRGHTLYAFKADSANHNRYTSADFSNNAVWPIYGAASDLAVPSVLDKTQFSTTGVFGRSQLTYKGWPLYFFGADSNLRAKNSGITVGSPLGTAGRTWPVMVQSFLGAPQP
ncbi:MAG TPA: hypothetical protein VN616_09900 [Puia sp.]|nr:hypothetical protein [Puia sp.]